MILLLFALLALSLLDSLILILFLEKMNDFKYYQSITFVLS
ncbi:hypothetical protein HMPREF5505_1004 [Lactobacillus delbrueckii subsp. lactis DSM 20072]|nr:hypothetical protein HMPREF5505_1004 [Lactobacillus delbrueckii subsp. lactis DSM 20072]